ncbi:MAG: hypothetical protein AAF694_13725 [Bacteroidota bacterium]
MWFQTLMGFQEKNPDQVRSNCGVEGDKLVSLVNGKQYTFGSLETPSLADLRSQSKRLDIGPGKIHLSERVADVQELHMDPKNAHALFQVASQFNLLEMLGPNRTPEEGVGIYSFDRTQGPACAIAAGAGTIYRNYFVEVNGTIGQRVDKQIDCLADLGALLGNHEQRIWNMQNGYVLPSGEGLKEVAKKLKGMGEEERDILRSALRIGLQWSTEVTLMNPGHLVSQAYCSALPVAYSSLPAESWANFAQLILEAAYEATLHAGLINLSTTGNPKVFLTLLGGGAFGNRDSWIFSAIRRAITLFKNFPLEVVFVSYGSSNSKLNEFILGS